MNQNKSMLRLASEGFVITSFGDVINKGFGVLTTFIVLFWITPYDYGIWRLLQSILTATSFITLTGLLGLLVADVARELGAGREKRANQILWRMGGIFLTTGIVAALLLVIGAPIVSRISGIGLSNYILVLASTLVVGSVLQILQVFFQARLQPIHAFIVKNLGNLAYLLGILLFLPYLKLGVWGLVFAYTASIVVPVLFYLPYVFREFNAISKERQEGAYATRDLLLGRGRWALFTDYASIAVSASWPWLVGYFLSIEQVGYAGLAIVIVSQVFSLVPLQYVLRAILPRFAEEPSRMQDWIQRALRYSLWVHAAAALIVISCSFIVFPFIFPSYAVAAPLAAALLISFPFRALSAVLTEWFYAKQKQKELFYSTAIPKLISVLFLPPLLHFFGMVGFVVWYVFSSDAILLARWGYVKKDIPIRADFRSLLIPDARDIEYISKLINTMRSKIAL